MQQISFALFNVPDDFPLTPYEEVYQRARGYRNSCRTNEGDQHALSIEAAHCCHRVVTTGICLPVVRFSEARKPTLPPLQTPCSFPSTGGRSVLHRGQ